MPSGGFGASDQSAEHRSEAAADGAVLVGQIVRQELKAKGDCRDDDPSDQSALQPNDRAPVSP